MLTTATEDDKLKLEKLESVRKAQHGKTHMRPTHDESIGDA